MADGKKGIAPCGHPGIHVVGQYVQCTKGCDDFKGEEPTPTFDPTKGIDIEVDLCPSCGSDNVADFDTTWQPLFDPQMHCWDCGKTWTK